MKIDNSIDYNQLSNILNKYKQEKRFTLAILQDIQTEFNYIPKEAVFHLAEYLNIPVSEIYSMATFYKALSLTPKGKHIIKVCNGTACHIRGSNILIDEIKDLLKIKPGETTADGLFSLEIVNCLGACALAPVMVIDNKYYGAMTKEKVMEVINEYKEAAYD